MESDSLLTFLRKAPVTSKDPLPLVFPRHDVSPRADLSDVSFQLKLEQQHGQFYHRQAGLLQDLL